MLSRALLAGEQTPEQAAARCERILARRWRWLRPLAVRYIAAFAGKTRPRLRDVIAFLHNDQGLQRAWAKHRQDLHIQQWLTEPQRMLPVAAAAQWNLPSLASERALSDWLHLDWEELIWLAGVRRTRPRNDDPRLRHYHYRVLAKPFGAVRLIDSPKQRLKEAQRLILTGILNRIPAHDAVHGFVRGRSIKSFAAPHVGQQLVLRLDLKEFFPSVPAARVQAIFRTAGYPDSVAALLAGLSTNAVPRGLWSQAGAEIAKDMLAEARALYARSHLPQGAPTSPAIANLCAYRMDCRLSGLAASAGARYTRYADDLAFSGVEAFSECVERFLPRAAAIVLEEGFTINYRKTRLMRQSQRQVLAGLMANATLNIPRDEFDQLKAILTNCVRHGPSSQNRTGHPSFRAHLQGQVAFVAMINAGKGERLRQIFDRIAW